MNDSDDLRVSETETVLRIRGFQICPSGVELPEYPRINEEPIASVKQGSDEEGVFRAPPMVRFAPEHEMTRKQWEVIKRHVDRAFDAFEKRWPSP